MGKLYPVSILWAEWLTSSRIFGLSSQYPTGSLGRQIIWIFAGIIAIVAIISAVMLPEITKPDPTTEAEVDEQPDDEERQRLLNNQN